MKKRMAYLACLLWLVGGGGCVSTSDFGWEVTNDFNGYRFEEALTKLEPKLRSGRDKDLALNYLRTASCALSCGQYERAKEALLGATEIMERFEPDGEFKAVIAAESAKDFLGDPYEQMMAFFYLGLLDYREGEYDKALASFKTALLADAGSREERYRADSSLLHLMMGRCYQRLGEAEAAEECFGDAKRVAYFRPYYRGVLQALTAAKEKVEADVQEEEGKEELETAKELCVRELSMAAMSVAGYQEVLAATSDGAIDLMGLILESEKVAEQDKELRKVLAKEQRRGRVLEYISQLEASAGDALSRIDTAALERDADGVSGLVDALSGGGHNVLVFVEMGKAPYKYRLGEYGEVYAVGRGWCPASRCELKVDGGEEGACCRVEDVYYQASTRGGRAMDAVLRDKAIFKDVTRKSSDLAFDLSREMSNSASMQSAEAAMVMQMAALAFLLVSETTRAEVDVRYWEMLASEVHLFCGSLAPGEHTLELTFFGQNEDGEEVELEGYGQRWEVGVDGGENVYMFRSGPNRPTNGTAESAIIG